MKHLGISMDIRNTPELDPGFLPLGLFLDRFLETAAKPVSFAVVRGEGGVSVYDTFIHGTPEMAAADRCFAERIVKLLLWMRGGVEVIVCGDDGLAEHIRGLYRPGGARAFDAEFMARVYEGEFAVRGLPLSQRPEPVERPVAAGGGFAGCRIGFDAGGSDRKVSAVIDGEAVYSEEVVWYPKINQDPAYHYQGILEAMRTAASKMPRVDAIGVSSAGIYVNNRTMVASLFLQVPPDRFEAEVKDIYIRAAAEFGDVPLVVANDGDVAALAGAMALDRGNLMGIAMGTSEAAGYVDADRNITGWLNELAFAPVDLNPGAMEDEWSGDTGCGVKYFSQDGVIKLAAAAGIPLEEDQAPAQKLKAVQALLEQGDGRAAAIYRSIGVYLGHTVNLYSRFYRLDSILLMGRVMSGEGGALILEQARRVLREEYPALAVELALPDEKSRRVGQSVAAAGLPHLP